MIRALQARLIDQTNRPTSYGNIYLAKRETNFIATKGRYFGRLIIFVEHISRSKIMLDHEDLTVSQNRHILSHIDLVRPPEFQPLTYIFSLEKQVNYYGLM